MEEDILKGTVGASYRGKLADLEQNKTMLNRVKGEIGEVAALVVGVIEDMIIQYSFSVPTTAWAANSEYTGYSYAATITAYGVIVNSNLNVTLDIPSVVTARKAGVASACRINAGSIRLYAKRKPTAALSGVIFAPCSWTVR